MKEQSATFSGPLIENIGLGVDHYGLNKFDERSYEYRLIFAELARILKEIEEKSADLRHNQYSVPFRTDDAFTERHSLTAELEHKVKEPFQGTELGHAVSITGLGGSGKTQLVLRFVETHRKLYDPILWINAESDDTFLSSFRRCALALKLKRDDTLFNGGSVVDAPVVVDVRSWLESRTASDPEWLVVVDNLDDGLSNARNLIPNGKRGTVLVTSRDNLVSLDVFDAKGQSMQVGSMNKEEATALLLNAVDTPLGSETDGLHVIAEGIAVQLDMLPLAVGLARAAIRAEIEFGAAPNIAMSDYLADYNRHRDDILQQAEFSAHGPGQKTVGTVWDTSMMLIERRYGEAPMQLLRLLAFFSAQNVASEIFSVASENLDHALSQEEMNGDILPQWLRQVLAVDSSGQWDSYHYREAIKALQRYNLVQPTVGRWKGTTMHALVKWRATTANTKSLLWQSFLIVLEAATFGTFQNADERMQFWQQLVEHFPSSEDLRMRKAEILSMVRTGAFFRLVEVSYQVGLFTQAHELYVLLHDMLTSQYGEGPLVTESMQTLALLSSKLNLFDDAEMLLLQVVQRDPTSAKALVQVAAVYSSQTRPHDAERVLVNLLEKSQHMRWDGGNTEKSGSVVDAMVGLAILYHTNARYHDAEKVLLRAIEMTWTNKENLGVGRTFLYLALVYFRQDRLPEAESVLRSYLERVIRCACWDDPNLVMESYHTLGLIYCKLGEPDKSEHPFLQVVKMRHVVQKQNPIVSKVIFVLRLYYASSGRWQDLEELRRSIPEYDDDDAFDEMIKSYDVKRIFSGYISSL